MASDLQKELEDIGAFTRIVKKFQKEKFDKFNVLKNTKLPKLDQAKDEQEFKAAKAECEEQLEDVQIDHDAEADMMADLEKHVTAAKSALAEERSRIAELKKKLKEISDRIDKHNKAVKEFNKTADKKSQKKPIKPDDSLAKLIQADEKTADAAEKKVSESVTFLEAAKKLQQSDTGEISKKRILIDNRTFQAKSPAGR